MKPTEFYRWWLPPNAWHKTRYLSSFKLSREAAAQMYPGAEPDLSTLEIRDCPEDNGEALRTTLSGGTSERPSSSAKPQ